VRKRVRTNGRTENERAGKRNTPTKRVRVLGKKKISKIFKMQRNAYTHILFKRTREKRVAPKKAKRTKETETNAYLEKG
jgi:predicted nucleic-acid-binding Zn-ribbon protein